MPTVADNFNISDPENANGSPIEIIDQDSPTVAVSIWQKQGIGDDTPLLSGTAWFYGSSAEHILDNFMPGMPIYIRGDMTVEVGDNGYLEMNINDASFSYVPQDRSSGQQQVQGRDTAAQNPSGSAPSQPAPRGQGRSQGGRNQGGGNQGGQNGNRGGRSSAPEPRSRR